MASNPSPSSSVNTALNAALSVEIEVLTLLLQRNHNQQHRCIYYRRISMVLLALRRATTASSSSLDWLVLEELERLSGQYVYRQKQQQQEKKKNGGDGSTAADIHSYSRKRKLKEEHWTIQRDEEYDTIKIIHDNDTTTTTTNDDDELQQTNQLINKLQTIRTLTTKTIPQLSSRIIHATSPIVQDLSRGYFVPFLTVALACLARIHVLVLRFGRELVGVACQCVPTLRECVADENDGGGGSLIEKKLKEALSPFTVNMHTTSIKEGSSEAPSNEWNELMKPFTEITHDEFTKKVNNFVTERRWKDAMVAFGIKEEDWNELHLSEEQLLSSVQENEDKDGNENVDMSKDDMGELVHMQHDNNNEKDDTTTRSNAGIDDNMYRVLDKKRRIDNETTSTTSAKKKKRRRKKKKSSDDAEVGKDAVDTDIKSSGGGTKAESNERAGNIKKTAVEVTNTASNQSDGGKKSSSDALLQKSTLSPNEPVNLEDEMMLDTQEGEAIEHVPKKEKKSKKKKTKKKKSKNVIDDIFG